MLFNHSLIKLLLAFQSFLVTPYVVLAKCIHIQTCLTFQSWDATSISLSAACDLFMRFVTRTSHLEHEKFDAAKSRLIERGEKFGEISLKVTSNLLPSALLRRFMLCTNLVRQYLCRLARQLQCSARISS
jgi:hypothetical protein